MSFLAEDFKKIKGLSELTVIADPYCVKYHKTHIEPCQVLYEMFNINKLIKLDKKENSEESLPLPISSEKKVPLVKIGPNTYKLRVPVEYDILCSVVPVFPELWIKEVSLTTNFGNMDEIVISTHINNNLFFNKPITKCCYIEYSITLTLDDLVEKLTNIDGAKNIPYVIVTGLMLQSRQRLYALTESGRIITNQDYD
jgi:hypothetical protein